MKKPKISIITCTYNSEKYIAECIRSVMGQTYKNIEHLFIDGASGDNTLEIIRKYYRNPKIYSEPDQGIYDALNKGIKRAAGDIVGILHSDDVYFDKGSLERVVSAFADNPGLDYYSAKMYIYDELFKKHFAVLGAPTHKSTLKEKIYSSNYFAHPTYYIRKEVIKKVGYYNTDYRIASDIDWLIRLEKLKLNFYFDNQPLVKFRSTGISAKKYIFAVFEEFKIRIKHDGFSISLGFLYFYHFIRRLVRFFLEKLGLSYIIIFFRKRLLNLQKSK